MTKSIVDVLKHQKFYMSLLGFALVDATDEAKEGTWTDFGGNPLTYTNWGSGQPGVNTDRNLAVFDGFNGKWYTQTSSGSVTLVCQKKLTSKS